MRGDSTLGAIRGNPTAAATVDKAPSPHGCAERQHSRNWWGGRFPVLGSLGQQQRSTNRLPQVGRSLPRIRSHPRTHCLRLTPNRPLGIRLPGLLRHTGVRNGSDGRGARVIDRSRWFASNRSKHELGSPDATRMDRKACTPNTRPFSSGDPPGGCSDSFRRRGGAGRRGRAGRSEDAAGGCADPFTVRKT